MLEMVGRIAGATHLPVSADLEGGFGDAVETVRRAIGLGVVGADIEDQMKPVAEAARQVAVMKMAEAEGVDFVLNARTDAFLRAGDRDPAEVMADAIERGRAYLNAGAPVFLAVGRLDQGAGLDDRRRARTTAGQPDGHTRGRASWPAEELGVARVSYGPMRRTSPSPHSPSWSRRCTAGAAYRRPCGC